MKAIFPASYSTLDVSALAIFITEKYGWQNVLCTFVLRGVGDTYLVETAVEKYILRVYRGTHRSLAQITAEVTLLTTLKNEGVSVSYPVVDTANEAIQAINAIEGIRHAVLFTYAAGKSAHVLSEKQLINLGVEMAKFHNVSSTLILDNSRWSFNAETKLFKPLRMLQQAFIPCPAEYKWLQQTAKRVEKHFDNVDTSSFSKGWCHFDFLPKNFHFDDDDNITLFDFDFFGHGWLVNDIMTFWQHLYLDVYTKRMTQEDADKAYNTFIAGYRTTRAISDEELAAVPYLSIGFWLFYMGFHTTHEQFTPFIQPAQLKMRTALLQQLVEKYWVTGS